MDIMTPKTDGRVIKLKCQHCGTVYATLQNGTFVIQSRHHGEKHVNVINLEALVRLWKSREVESMIENEAFIQRKSEITEELLGCERIVAVDYEPQVFLMKTIPTDGILIKVEGWSEEFQQPFLLSVGLSEEMFLDRRGLSILELASDLIEEQMKIKALQAKIAADPKLMTELKALQAKLAADREDDGSRAGL